MKRKLLCSLLAAASLTVSARAAEPVPVQVDGSVLSDRGQLAEGVTYVPLRSLLEAMGDWDVSWDDGSRQAVAQSRGRSITADPAADTVTVDGKVHNGSVYLLEGRTYVPLRTTAEALGASVDWDSWMSGAAVTTAEAEHGAQDLYWLARIISAESRGEPLEGQLAVGNVVLNRVASDEFPDTIPEVIFDRRHAIQFEPVENGTVYLSPTALSEEAARLVLDGEEVIGKCLYFYAPALSKGVWINANRPYFKTIGCHRFYL